MQGLVVLASGRVNDELILRPAQKSRLLRSPLGAVTDSDRFDDPLAISGLADLEMVECSAGLLVNASGHPGNSERTLLACMPLMAIARKARAEARSLWSSEAWSFVEGPVKNG